MKKTIKETALRVAFILTIIIFSSQTVFSQSIWVEDFENESKVGVELIVPSYSFTGDERGVDFATNIYTNIPISRTWMVKVAFPISRFDGGGSKLSSGNPFVGFQHFVPNSGFKLDFGARLPTIQQSQSISYLPRETFGVASYNELITAVRFNLHYKWNSDSNWSYNIGQGLEAVAAADGPMALLFKFYGQAHYKVNDQLKVGFGIDGDLLTNRNHYLYAGRSRIQLGLVGSYDLGKVEVGGYIKESLFFAFDSDPNLIMGLNFKVSF